MLEIRSGGVQDLARLVALENDSFVGDRLSRRSLRRHLGNASSDLLVALDDGELAAYALVLRRRGSRLGRIYSIAVDARARGRGLGQCLLDAIECQARRHDLTELRLEVRTDNEAAVRLYRRNGYQPFGRHAGYYADGVDALRLRKLLHVAAPEPGSPGAAQAGSPDELRPESA